MVGFKALFTSQGDIACVAVEQNDFLLFMLSQLGGKLATEVVCPDQDPFVWAGRCRPSNLATIPADEALNQHGGTNDREDKGLDQCRVANRIRLV